MLLMDRLDTQMVLIGFFEVGTYLQPPRRSVLILNGQLVVVDYK